MIYKSIHTIKLLIEFIIIDYFLVLYFYYHYQEEEENTYLCIVHLCHYTYFIAQSKTFVAL